MGLLKRVGAGIKHRWEERQEDRKRRSTIDAQAKARRKDAYYASYEKAKFSNEEKAGALEGARSAKGRRMPKLNVDMGTLARGGASAQAGLDFLSKDVFGGSGSTDIFGTSKKGSRSKLSEGGPKTISVRSGGTRITVKSSSDEERVKKERSISQNIEDMLDLGDLGNENGNGKRKKRNSIEDILGF